MDQAPHRRRRDAELLEAIREAVRGEITDLGFAGLTFEGVARRTHTSKPVLYRRFATRAEMAIDAFIPHRFATPPAPVTGHLHDDVVALLSGMAARVTREDVTTMRGIIGEVDESLIEHVGALTFSQLDDWLHAVFDAARAHGDLGPQPVPASATRTVVAVLRHELIFSRAAGNDPDFAQIAREALVPMLRAATA